MFKEEIPHFIEFYNCTGLEKRKEYTLALEKAGFKISDEKINFKKNIIKFYLTIDKINGKIFEECLNKLKGSQVWFDCSWRRIT